MNSRCTLAVFGTGRSTYCETVGLGRISYSMLNVSLNSTGSVLCVSLTNPGPLIHFGMRKYVSEINPSVVQYKHSYSHSFHQMLNQLHSFSMPIRLNYLPSEHRRLTQLSCGLETCLLKFAIVPVYAADELLVGCRL